MKDIRKLSCSEIDILGNDEIIQCLFRLNGNDLKEALEYLSTNISSNKIPYIIDEHSFLFIDNMFNNLKFINNKGFFSWIVNLENSDLDFSKISHKDRYNLISKIIKNIGFYEEYAACEVGRFIIRCLLINKHERMGFFQDIKNNYMKIKNTKYLGMIHFALLDYCSNEELNEIEKKEINTTILAITHIDI